MHRSGRLDGNRTQTQRERSYTHPLHVRRITFRLLSRDVKRARHSPLRRSVFALPPPLWCVHSCHVLSACFPPCFCALSCYTLCVYPLALSQAPLSRRTPHFRARSRNPCASSRCYRVFQRFRASPHAFASCLRPLSRAPDLAVRAPRVTLPAKLARRRAADFCAPLQPCAQAPPRRGSCPRKWPSSCASHLPLAC